jgi:penicillin-binding protein 1C
VAVKTGTSSRYRDAWTVAWSRDYLVGVWVGHPDERPMTRLSGYRVAARLTQTVLERLHRDRLDGLAGVGFPPPRGHRRVALCALSGERATQACDRVAAEWLPEGAEPAPCAAHRRVAFDRRTGRLATAATPAPAVELRTLVALPPRYAAWLERQAFAAWDPTAPELAAAAEAGGSGALATGERSVRILSPEPGARLLLDPEAPAELNTLALAALVEPPAEQLVWYVDGRPFRTVEPPFAARWRLEPGEHWFEARVPFSPARSRAVRIRVEGQAAAVE